MAIAGKIIHISDVPEGIKIQLGPMGEEPYPNDHPGQDFMTIVNPTVRPLVGDKIWGGSDSVFIVSDGISFPYEREMYTQLKQAWNNR